VELALAVDLQKSALAHVAVSSCGKYTGEFNMFVAWCDARAEPRETLPASDGTVALYLQSVMNTAKTFAPVKAASAAIAFYQKINLFDHEPTQSPAVCVVRGAAMRKFGLNPKNPKEPFEWEKVVNFVEAYGVRHQGYCHLVVATMAVVMFGGMCRYDDASGLQWRNVRFVEDGSGFEITFDKRKNAQFRQGNKVLVAANPSATVCPLRMLRELRIFTGGSEDLFIFRGFNGRLVAKRPGSTAPGPDKITYDQFFRYLGQWFSGVRGVSTAVFRKQFATQSNRSGGASAALNAGVSDELIGQHGDWKTKAAQRRYMKSDTSRLLSVSRAAMGLSKTPAPDVRIECESAGVPPAMAEDDLPPDVIGVPPGAFAWS
jgi:integrase